MLHSIGDKPICLQSCKTKSRSNGASRVKGNVLQQKPLQKCCFLDLPTFSQPVILVVQTTLLHYLIWVFPTPGAPHISVILPRGTPPPSMASTLAQKVTIYPCNCSALSSSSADWPVGVGTEHFTEEPGKVPLLLALLMGLPATIPRISRASECDTSSSGSKQTNCHKVLSKWNGDPLWDDLPLLSSTIDRSLRSSALSKPADISLAWWPVERGNELKGRCIPRSVNLQQSCRLIFPPCAQYCSAMRWF